MAKLRIDRKGLELDVKQAVLGEAIIESNYGLLTNGAADHLDLISKDTIPLVLRNKGEDVRFRLLRMMEDSDKDAEKLIRQFEAHPTAAQALCRINIMKLLFDDDIAEDERADVIKAFVDAYIDLVVQLDNACLPPCDDVMSGVPAYIPDGLSDMGKDPSLGPDRDRERIRIRKRQLYELHRPFIDKIFTSKLSKADIVLETAKYIHGSRTYTRNAQAAIPGGEEGMSICIAAMGKKKVGVCRHDALHFQVLMQLFGIECRLVKCILNRPDGWHAVNLIRMDGKWYLIDVTNPDSDGNVFIRRIVEEDIDLNREQYGWGVKTRSGMKRNYVTHWNMFFRVRDNSLPLNGHGNEVAAENMGEDNIMLFDEMPTLEGGTEGGTETEKVYTLDELKLSTLRSDTDSYSGLFAIPPEMMTVETEIPD